MSRQYAIAAAAHRISVALAIPYGAAWRVSNCVNKTRYGSEEEAEEAAAKWDGRPQRAYECDVCGRWHLSSKEERA